MPFEPIDFNSFEYQERIKANRMFDELYKKIDPLVSEAGFVAEVGAVTEASPIVAWTPAMSSACRLWYSADDALNQAGTAAVAGEAVYSIPNRITSAVSRTDGLAMPLVPKGTNLSAGAAGNAPIKRNGNLLNGKMPISFGAVVSGTGMRLSTQAGAVSTNNVFRCFVVAAARGTSNPYIVNVSAAAGNGLARGDTARNLLVGFNTQTAGAFTDSAAFLLKIERIGTDLLFQDSTTLAASSVGGFVNGAQTRGNSTLATAQESSNQSFLIGTRWDADSVTDLDWWETVWLEGRATQADIYRVEGYLAHKYGLQTQLPGDHPYRSGAPRVPAGVTSAAQFDVVTSPWGYRQTVSGWMYQLMSDNIANNAGTQQSDYRRIIPYDLKPSERTRLAKLMKGSHAIRMSLGLYYRGIREVSGTSGLGTKIGPRWPGQRQQMWQFLKDSETDGAYVEYWSPAPHWKTTSAYGAGTLWAGGAYSRATTLASIRTTGPTITAATKANPCVITYSGTDPAANSLVYITGVSGMTELNGRIFRIASLNTAANTLALTDPVTGANIDSTAFGTWTAGGTLAFDYASQIDALTTVMVDDLEDIHNDDAYPIRLLGFSLQNEPLTPDADYGSCSYGANDYVDVWRSLIPKIRASTVLASWGGAPNTVKLYYNSWEGNGDALGAAVLADTVVLSTGKTVLQEMDHVTVHMLGQLNSDPNFWLTTNGTSNTSAAKPYYQHRVSAQNPTGIATASNEYEFVTAPFSRRGQMVNQITVWLNALNWTKAPYVTLIHVAKPASDGVVEWFSLFGWRPPGDDDPVIGGSSSYFTGLDYGEFAEVTHNYNGALPFIRWLKGAQWLLSQENTYSATSKVGACFTRDGKLVVFMLNASTSDVTISAHIGREARRLRPYLYSPTQRDVAYGTGATRSNVLSATVPATSMLVWVEC